MRHEMTNTCDRELRRIDAEVFQPRAIASVSEWARANIVVGSWSSRTGRYEPDPWTIQPMDTLGIVGPRRMIIVAPAGGGKSTIGEVFVSWAIENAPGLTAWYTPTEKTTKEFAETRLMRFLSACPSLSRWFDSMPRHARRNEALHFPHMSLLALPANVSNAQSKHLRHLVMDETHEYDPGMVSMLEKRTREYRHNCTKLLISTGSEEGDQTDVAWHDGTKQRWQIVCPICGHVHVPKWENVRWDPEAKREGIWDKRRVAESTHYTCPSCSAEIAANSANAIKINSISRGAGYTEPAADAVPRTWSFHWNCITSGFDNLGANAVDFINAMASARRGGVELMKDFTQKLLAEAWADKPPEISIAKPTNGYKLGEPVPDECLRLMAVDCQQTHFWAVVRSYSRTTSRPIAVARLESRESVREFQIANRVADNGVLIDSGHFTDSVYTACCRYGWVATKGESVAGGYVIEKDGVKLRAPCRVSESRPAPQFIEPGSVQPSCDLLLVSEELTSQVLDRCRSGKLDSWSVADDMPESYTAQMNARRRIMKRNTRDGSPEWEWRTFGKCGEHLWDCERVLLAAAYEAGVYEFEH